LKLYKRYYGDHNIEEKIVIQSLNFLLELKLENSSTTEGQDGGLVFRVVFPNGGQPGDHPPGDPDPPHGDPL